VSNNLYIPFHPGDYLTDTAHLTAAEHGAYLLLILNYWQRGEPLMDDDKRLRGIARMTADEWAESRETILEFFERRDGALFHKRIEAELERAREKSSKAKDSGRRGAVAKRTLSERQANAEQSLSERPANQDQVQEQDREEEASASSSAAEAAEKSEAEEIEEIACRLEDATGWVLPGVHLIRSLVSAGHSLDGRVIPLASETAASIRRLGKPRPESWAYLKAIVEDNYREPQAASRASKAAQELVKIPQSDPLWARAAETYQSRTGKRPVVVDGVSYFRPEFLPAKEGAAA
jgi:uncharacterized protein YdaU (DUF1376 family)